MKKFCTRNKDKLIYAICVFVFLLFISCTGPDLEQEGNGKITISIGGASGRFAWPSTPAYTTWSHEIIIKNSSHEETSGLLSAGTTSHTFTGVPAGTYDVEVWAKYSGSVVAVGSGTATVGGSPAAIEMCLPVWIGPNPRAKLGDLERYIYWTGDPTLLTMEVLIHPLIWNSFTQPVDYQLCDGLSPISSLSPISNSTFNVALSTYSDDINVKVTDGIDTYITNSVEVWEAIKNQADLIATHTLPNHKYILTNDVIIDDTYGDSLSTRLPELGAGSTFDGNGGNYKLTFDPSVTSPRSTFLSGQQDFGLFGTINNNARIQNLKLDGNIWVSSTDNRPINIGAVVGSITGSGGVLHNVSSNVIINVTISTDTMPRYIGGIAGVINANCKIVNAHHDSYISFSGQGNCTAGGIAGKNSGIIEYCWVNHENVFVTGGTQPCVGGIAGENSGSIDHCVALESSIECYCPNPVPPPTNLPPDSGYGVFRIARDNSGTYDFCFVNGNIELRENVMESTPRAGTASDNEGDGSQSIDNYYGLPSYVDGDGWKTAFDWTWDATDGWVWKSGTSGTASCPGPVLWFE